VSRNDASTGLWLLKFVLVLFKIFYLVVIITSAVGSKVRQWAHKEHYKHWLNTEGCRQAKELVTQVTPGLTQFALRQCRRDLNTGISSYWT